MEALPQRGRQWISEQTALSVITFGLGAASLAVSLLGSAMLLALGGLTPFENIVESMNSPLQGGLLVTGLLMGLLATAAGAATYRRMPTRAAREASVAGGALGAQAILFCLLYLWFRQGEFGIFVRNFLNFQGLGRFMEDFLIGAKNTVYLALLGELFGIMIGLFLALLAMSRRVVVRAPARTYINFFRGTPLLWQLSFGFFGIVLGLRLELSPYQIAIIILSMNAGAYTAEIFRAGIQSIERGQVEAARSLGMSYLQSMRYVIVPQAFRRVIPPLTNEFVILIKDTSLVAILGLAESERELLKVGRDIYNDTFNATPFLASAAGYLAVTLPLFRLVSWLERKLRSGLIGVIGG